MDESGELRREFDSARSGESLRQSSEHRQIGMEHDALQAANAKRSQPVVMLEPTELALDRSTATVEIAVPLTASRDQRIAAAGLDPRRNGLAPTGHRGR
jgi:hypothetical protein